MILSIFILKFNKYSLDLFLSITVLLLQITLFVMHLYILYKININAHKVILTEKSEYFCYQNNFNYCQISIHYNMLHNLFPNVINLLNFIIFR